MSRRPVSQLSVTKIRELTGHYNHRLLSLEADLKDLARTGALRPRAFAKRVQQLRKMQQLVADVEASKSDNRDSIGSLSLPLLEHASPPEKQVCVHFFARRERWARSVRTKLEQVLRWLDSTIAGRGNFITNTLRLSKLHKYVREADRLIAIYDQELKTVEYHVEAMLGQMPKFLVAGSNTADVLGALAEIFRRLDATVSRVARLKSSVRLEEQKIGEMHNWLNHRQVELLENLPSVPAPSPMQTAVAGQAVEEEYDVNLGHCQDKLRLAHEFWQKVLGQSEIDQLDPSFLQDRMASPTPKLNKRDRKGARRRDRRRSGASVDREGINAP